jgi:hypothetical protein
MATMMGWTWVARRWPGSLPLPEGKVTIGSPVSHVRSHLRSGTMVMVMAGPMQLCCYCHEITERTSDGDRLACSMCGRPYLIAPPVQPMQFVSRPADLTPPDQST